MTKHFIWIAALLLTLGACSKEEQAQPAVAETTAVETPAPEAVTEEATSNEPATETLEVVEESAAVEEPEDEPIVLAIAEDADATVREWKYKEGEHYFRLVPTQPTVGGADKIEVAEAFTYNCPHCFTLEPYINEWATNKDPSVRFVRIPTMFNQVAQMHAQIYFTQDIMGRNGILEDPGCISQRRIRRVSPARKSPDVDGLDSQVIQPLRRVKRRFRQDLEVL